MLRRRILASAMASVMALGSVAIVASAEETAAATALVKSKTDLEAFIKEFDKFREDGIYDYGTVAGEQFQNTIDFAENVLNNDKATSEDYTAAYQMLKAVKESLKKYSAEELKTLLDGNAKIYNSQNIMNEDLSDLVYEEGSYANFADKYEYADSVLNSGDTRLITDAYLDLKSAIGGLNKLDVISKGDFRTALKNYEAIIDNASDYDSWRRGSVNNWIDDEYTTNYWAVTNHIAEGVTNFGTVVSVTLGDGKAWYTNADGSTWSATVFDTEGAATVKDYITDIYDELDSIKSVNQTTGEKFIKAYKIAVRATETFNKFTADNTNRAAKASVTKILDQYHKQLVAKYRTSDAEAYYLAVNGKAAPTGWDDAGNDYYEAELKNEGKKGVFTIDGESVTLAQGISILKYMNISSADVTNTATSDAMDIAEKYLAGQWSPDVYGLDDTGKVTTGNGSIAEWTLVYRNLKYALEDEFNGSKKATYTKKQVSDLANKAYDLADDTGDAAIFNAEHMALVDQRQAALEWIREANKDRKYKDGDVVAGKTSTEVYTDLNNAYVALEKKLATYKYSYGQVFYKIADVLDKIDGNDGLTMTDSMKAALDEVSVALALVEASDVDNDAYTTDRVFVPYNRVRTKDGNGEEKRLTAAYEALLAEVKKQETPQYQLGDVNKDGKINAFDAAEILKAVAENTIDKLENADFNGDKKIDAFDAAKILEYAANN